MWPHPNLSPPSPPGPHFACEASPGAMQAGGILCFSRSQCSVRSAHSSHSVNHSEGNVTFKLSVSALSCASSQNCCKIDASVQTCCATTTTLATQTDEPIARRPPLGPNIGASSGTPARAGRKRQSQPLKKLTRSVVLCSSNRALPQFAPTTRQGMQLVIINAISHINACGSGCCSFHITLARMALICKAMGDGSSEFPRSMCSTQFTPHAGWQCSHCTVMNLHEDDDELDDNLSLCCAICGSERSDNDSGHEGDMSSAGSRDDRTPRQAE